MTSRAYCRVDKCRPGHILLGKSQSSPFDGRRSSQWAALARQLDAEEHADEQTTDTDIAFHLAIAEASGNELFHQILISIVPPMKVAIPQAWRIRQTADERKDSVDQHRKLAQAIDNRDPNEARLWMSAHFDESVGIMLGNNR